MSFKSMKILVVHPESRWILSSIAQKMCEAMPEVFSAFPLKPPIARVGWVAPSGMDAHLYWDVQNCWHPEWRAAFPSAIHLGAYTHLDRDNNDAMREHWKLASGGPDGIIHMNERYRERFERQGWYPPERMTVLRPGEVNPFPLKKTKIGICQRGEHVGKGKDFLPEVICSLRPEIVAGMELHFKGKGWDDAFDGKITRGISFFGGDKPEKKISGSYYGISAFSYTSEDAKSYPLFYEKLDYFLVPSLYEGGPMSVLEAMAVGLPIISSEVGWVPEFKRIAHLYPAGDVDALAIILTEIVEKKLLRRTEVEGMSYKNYAAGVLEFFDKLWDIKNKGG